MIKKIDIHKYKTIIFDCDGVLLNSNHIKTSDHLKQRATYTTYDINAAQHTQHETI